MRISKNQKGSGAIIGGRVSCSIGLKNINLCIKCKCGYNAPKRGHIMEYQRESIFVSSVRSFLGFFAAFLGILMGLTIFIVAIFLSSNQTLLPEKENRNDEESQTD